TNDEAALALVGLIVVLARRKATMPAMLMLCPMRTSTSAMPMRTWSGTSRWPSEGANHMRNARHRATTGGGTLSSRRYMIRPARRLLSPRRVERPRPPCCHPTPLRHALHAGGRRVTDDIQAGD